MRFSVVHDRPGRLRLRLRCGWLTETEARGVEVAVASVPGVREAAVHQANGSLLVLLSASAHDEVLSCVRALDVLRLPTAVAAPEDVAQSLRLEDERFALEAGAHVMWTVLRRMLLPTPLRTLWVCWKACGHVLQGLRTLVGQLAVDVLDAAAIMACLLRGTCQEADTIMFLLRLSDIMEGHVARRTRLALEQGLVERASTLWLVREGGADVAVSPQDVGCGDLLRFRSGMVLAVDGSVVLGESEVNEASVTGEAALVHKRVGSTVYAGTALEDGELVVAVTAPPGTARIDAVAQMVERSSELKAESQGRAERIADGLVPVAFAAFFSILAVTRSMEKALAVLMVDYSCALRLSTPIAVMSAMREAAARGVVVKGGKYLEALAEADTVVFDKTGTLTEASPKLVQVVSAGRVSEGEILRLAACIEEHYPHSVARAIVEGAAARGLSHERELHTKVQYVVAHGIAAEADGKEAVIGSAHFVFEDEEVPLPDGFEGLVESLAPGASRVYLARDGELLGALCVDDPLRPSVALVLDQLRELGLSEQVMLTGDAERAAREVARAAGVSSYRAQVLPEDKARYVERLEAEGHRTVMVGDGINDSPALAAASVSVALADASDIARTVADVSIRDTSLEQLVFARALSLSLQRRIAGRYRLIVGFNSLLIVLGVASLIPLTTAATLHNLSTLVIAASNTRPLLRVGDLPASA